MKETNYHRDFLYFVPYFLGEREEEGVQWSTLTLNKKKLFYNRVLIKWMLWFV